MSAAEPTARRESPAGTLWPAPPRERWALFAGQTLDRLYGRGTGGLLPELERSQWWGAERLAELQRRRLEELLLYCWDRVPFYRRRFERAGIARRDIAAGEPVLERLPPLTRDELHAAGAELRVAGSGRTIVCSTSGSSGEPVTVWQDLPTAAATRAAQRRAFRWHGVEPHERRVMMLSAPRDRAKALKHRLVDLLTGRRLFEFHRLDDAALDAAAAFIARYRPAFVTAYPSVLHELCLRCEATGVSLAGLGVRLLHSQSEMLLDLHREAFARVFGELQVLDEYGCVEVGGMAYTCPHGGRHVSHEQLLLEVVGEGGAPMPEGEAGDILLTPLAARAMPLLRYRLGDRGALSTEPCACGRMPGAPLLERIEGRTFERIVGADGRAINSGIVHFIVRQAGVAPALQQYLAVQHEPGAVEFLIVTDETDRSLEQRLADAGRRILGAGFEVSCRRVEAIPRPAGRKRSYFSSRLGDEETR